MDNQQSNSTAEDHSAAPSLKTALHRPVSVNFSSRRTVLTLAWLIFAAALILRLSGLGQYPARHATDDEFFHLWSGLNFWAKGVPEAWSNLPAVSDVRVGSADFEGNGYNISSPALDHPPLFSLLSGGFAWFTQPQRIDTVTSEGKPVTFWNVDLTRARLLMILIFSATFWMLFALTRLSYSPPTALLTVLFYGFMSHAVTHGRLLISDNLTALLLVANVWVIQRWLCGRASQRNAALWTIAFTAAAVINKVPAWCHVPAIMAMLLIANQKRQIRSVLIGFGVGLALYLVWISWYGLPDFIAVMRTQSNRFRGFNAFQLMSGIPRLLDVGDLNGIIIAGWFCMVAQALKPGGKALTVVGPVFILAFTFFAGDFLFGWYAAPLYPWFAVALGITTAQLYRRPRSAMMFAWLLLFLPHAFQTLYIARYDLETVLRYAFMVTTAGLVFAFALPDARAKTILRIAIIAIMSVVLMREVYEVAYQRTDRLTDQEKYLR